MVEKISFFRSYYESIKDQDPATYKEALNAVFAYVFDDADISIEDLSPSARMFFILVKPYIDTSLKKSANGKHGGSKSEANDKQNESKPKANPKQKPSNKNKNIEVEVEEEIEVGNNNAREPRIYDYKTLVSQFDSREVGEAMCEWLDCRLDNKAIYPPAAMSDDINKAMRYEKQYGGQAVIDVLKASLTYQRPVWDRLGRSQPKARSGTESGTDYLLRRIAEEEAKEKANAE